MYRMYCDKKLLYDPALKEYALDAIQCEMEVNKTGSLSFKIPPTHPCYGSIQKLKSEITLYQDGEWVFSGRVLNDDIDFHNIRTVACEGELAYLLDSNQRAGEYHNISVKNYFTMVVEKHNADVEEQKRFLVGAVTVTDPNDSLYRFANYEDSWHTLMDKLVDRLGGYIRVRHEEDGKYLDYVVDYGNVNTQVIQFGENIISLARQVRGDEIASVIIPIGSEDEETGEKLTIKSVNEGKDYIEDSEAVAAYGRVVKTVEFPNVTVAANLLTKGYAALAQQRLLQVTLDLNAVDLHLLDVDMERIKLGDSIRVLSPPHGIDEYMMVTQMKLDLGNPENSRILLGTKRKTLTDVTVAEQKKSLTELVEAQKSTENTISGLQVEVKECYSEIYRTAEEIQQSVSNNYLLKTDLETVQHNLESTISQSATDITFQFMTYINEITGSISTNQTLMEEYIRFRGALIELGRVGNAFTAQLNNEELAFLENGQKIAYISNQNLFITDTEIQNKLSLGNVTRGWFDFIPRQNGNLSIQWRDPTG